MITNLSKKYYIKIPKDVKVIYFEKKNIIILKGPLKTKILKVHFKLYIQKDHNFIYVTKITDFKNITKRKKVHSARGTIISQLKQTILEISVIFTKKLKLIGVGYKVFPLSVLKNELLEFKLGFSHFIYYKIPTNLKIIPHKSTSIYISGYSYDLINQVAANIRQYKKPEPYKGKGILYDVEKIILKQGKKI